MTARKKQEPTFAPFLPDVQVELVIRHGKGEMTKEQLKLISTWLKAKAADVVKEGRDYARRFSARYEL